MSTFEVGKTYRTRPLGDSEMRVPFTILSRTSKTVQVEVDGKVVKRGLRIHDGREMFLPWGSYSMAPCIFADRV